MSGESRGMKDGDQERIARRMVALAIKPYLKSDRKLRSLHRRAVIEEVNEAAEATALELQRPRLSAQMITEVFTKVARRVGDNS